MRGWGVVGVLVAAGALAGCQTTGNTAYVKYADGPDLDYSKARCAIGAMGTERSISAWGSPSYVFAAELGNIIENAARRAEFTEHCMVMHGWKKVRIDPKAQAERGAAQGNPAGVERSARPAPARAASREPARTLSREEYQARRLQRMMESGQ